MKRIMLRDRGTFKARDVITTMLEMPPQNTGVTYAEIRKRDRVLDTLDRFKDERYVDLEDADYDVLNGILQTFPFATAKRELRQILDDIANAKAPEETPQLKVVEDAS